MSKQGICSLCFEDADLDDFDRCEDCGDTE